jgi:hypothetical protein
VIDDNIVTEIHTARSALSAAKNHAHSPLKLPKPSVAPYDTACNHPCTSALLINYRIFSAALCASSFKVSKSVVVPPMVSSS